MTLDPVAQWKRFVAAWNDRDWQTYESLIAEDYQQEAVMGAVHSPTPTTFDKPSAIALIKRWAESHGLRHHTQSVTGAGNTVVTIYEERFDDGTAWIGYAIVRFNDDGQVVEAYTAVPAGVQRPPT